MKNLITRVLLCCALVGGLAACGGSSSSSSSGGLSTINWDNDEVSNEPVELTTMNAANYKLIASHLFGAIDGIKETFDFLEEFMDYLEGDAIDLSQYTTEGTLESSGNYGCFSGGDANYQYIRFEEKEGNNISTISTLPVKFDKCLRGDFNFISGDFVKNYRYTANTLGIKQQENSITRANIQIRHIPTGKTFNLTHDGYYKYEIWEETIDHFSFRFFYTDNSEFSLLNFTKEAGGVEFLDTVFVNLQYPGKLQSTVFLEIDSKANGIVRTTYTINGKDGSQIIIEDAYDANLNKFYYNIFGLEGCMAAYLNLEDIVNMNYCK